MAAWWRHLVLAALVAGLLLAPALAAPAAALPLCAGAAALLAAVRARPQRLSPGPVWTLLAAASAALAGLAVGDARLAASANGAAPGEPGTRLTAEGVISAAPKASQGALRAPLETPAGAYLLVLGVGGPEPAVGDAVRVGGELAVPDPWRVAELARLGAHFELRAERIEVLGPGRYGLSGFLDRVRRRAERGIAAGLDPGQAALARGFVLGQDDRIDPSVREDFKRSGLAHLLAVSGQNVMLLAILAGLLLGLAGITPRARVIATIVLICAYVPVAGAGPSIQRAGVMGVAGLLATVAGRPSDRAWLPLLAAAATLALNPLAAGDVGWQLSFAAVIGIALWAAPLRRLLMLPLARPWPLVGAALPQRLVAPLAEGGALTFAATVATAPLMAHHFGSFPLASLPANLLVLPAVAPVMWLGMLASLLGQIAFLPTAPLASVEGPLLDLIAAVAAALGEPSWALVEIDLPGPQHVVVAYVVLLAGMTLALAALARRRGLGTGARPLTAVATGGALLVLAAAAGLGPLAPQEAPAGPPARTLRITALDIGQGDAILLEPPRGAPVLVDTGPPGGGVGAALATRSIDRLAALVITHTDLDHSGARSEVESVALPDRIVAPAARVPAPEPGAALPEDAVRLAAGDSIRLGRLRLDVLWPPRHAAAGDPNELSLVLGVRFGRWRALLTGDAEQEATRLVPGPLDVLKVAHHGSVDAGLERLLALGRPRVALISAGRDNRHGHPAPETLAAIAAAGACTLRTDLGGDVSVELGPGGLRTVAAQGEGGCGPRG